MLSSSIRNPSIPDRHIYFNTIPDYHMKRQSHKTQPKIRVFMKSFETKSKDYQDFTKSCQTRLKWPALQHLLWDCTAISVEMLSHTVSSALMAWQRWLWPVLFLTFTSNPSLSCSMLFFLHLSPFHLPPVLRWHVQIRPCR